MELELEDNNQIENIYINDLEEVKDIFANYDDCFKFLLLNVRSFSSLPKFDDYKQLLRDLGDMDFAISCETWIKESMKQLYMIPGYNAHFACRTEGYGGVAIHIRNEYQQRLVSEISNGYHILGVEIVLPTYGKILVIGVYFPPGQTNDQYDSFIESLEQVLSTTSARNIVIGGDLNIDIRVNNSRVDHWKNFLSSYSLRI